MTTAYDTERYPQTTPSGAEIQYASVNLAVLVGGALARAETANNVRKVRASLGMSAEELADLFDPGVEVYIRGESLRLGSAALFSAIVTKQARYLD